MWSPTGTHATPDMSPEQAAAATRWERPAMVASFLVIPYLLLNFGFSSGWGDIATDVLYWGLWGFFVIEAVFMVKLSPSFKSWAKANVVDVGLIVLTAPLILTPWTPHAMEVLQVLWLVRILDILPLVHKHLFRITPFKFGAILWLLTIIAGGIAFPMIEPGAQSFVDGLYWANTTISTVGYGDYSPTTPVGKFMAMGLQVLGVVIAAIFVAGIIPLFDKEFTEGFGETDGFDAY